MKIILYPEKKMWELLGQRPGINKTDLNNVVWSIIKDDLPQLKKDIVEIIKKEKNAKFPSRK